ncbi:MAG TPA: hypothetical protein VGM87_09870 [Roseomonas sp.]|jgi:hypothetical protein
MRNIQMLAYAATIAALGALGVVLGSLSTGMSAAGMVAAPALGLVSLLTGLAATSLAMRGAR